MLKPMKAPRLGHRQWRNVQREAPSRIRYVADDIPEDRMLETGMRSNTSGSCALCDHDWRGLAD